MFNMAKFREQARRRLHDTLAVPATYTLSSDGTCYSITARLHRKTDVVGEGDGFAQMIVEVDRVVLLVDQLPGPPERGDSIYFPDENTTVTVDTVEPMRFPEQVCNVNIEDD